MARQGRPPRPVRIGKKTLERLRRIARSRRKPQNEVCRARILVKLVRDPSPQTVAAQTSVHERTVRRVRDRFLQAGLHALKDRKRSGRPPSIPPITRCQILAMACGKPGEFGVFHTASWTYGILADTWRARFPDAAISRSSVVRILLRAHIRPHRIKMWCHSPDPRFREKATALCELYLHPPPGSTLLCVDEKPGIQALGRRFPVKAATMGQPGRVDHHYKRNGTRKLIAAFNVQTGEVYGQMRAHRKAADLVAFMEEVARRHPTGPVHIVWDNLNIHYDGKDKRWTAFNARHGGRFHFHYTPIHASWLNQIEIWFGLLQRRIIKRGVFDSLAALDKAVLGFIAHYNSREASPYNWTFTGYPLDGNQVAA